MTEWVQSTEWVGGWESWRIFSLTYKNGSHHSYSKPITTCMEENKLKITPKFLKCDLSGAKKKCNCFKPPEF